MVSKCGHDVHTSSINQLSTYSQFVFEYKLNSAAALRYLNKTGADSGDFLYIFFDLTVALLPQKP